MTPSIRVEVTDPAIGTLGEDNYQLLRQPDGVHICNVFSPKPVRAVSITVVGGWIKQVYPEHLGMQVNTMQTPTGWGIGGDFPGAWQGPWLLGHTATTSCLLAALQWEFPLPPLKLRLEKQSLSLRWDCSIPAGQPQTFKFLYLEVTGGTEKERACQLLDRYRAHMPVWDKSVDWGHGQINVQLQDQAQPLQHLARVWADYGHQFKRIQCWGQQGDGKCCTPQLGSLDGLDEFAFFVGQSNARVGVYLRPDKGNGVVDPPWLKEWRNHFCDPIDYVASYCYYIDTAGFRDMRGCTIYSHDLIEGATLDLPNPALVSNCLSGGAFSPDGKARYPKTLPDGTPHPLNPEPWITSAPWLGKYLMRERTMVLGHENTDAYYSALYWTMVDGQRKEWVDHLWKMCLLLDLPMSVRHPSNATVQAIIAERERVGWSSMDREWLGMGEWKDRKTGKRYKATTDPISITEAAP